MDNAQSKTFYDFFVVLVPVTVSMLSFFLGKWWESRTVKNSNKFALERDKINNQLNNKLQIFDKTLTSFESFFYAHSEALIFMKMSEEYSRNPDKDEEEMLNRQETALEKAKGFSQFYDSVFGMKVRLSMVGLDKHHETVDKMAEIFNNTFLIFNEELDFDEKCDPFNESISSGKELEGQFMKDLSEIFTKFWGEYSQRGKFEIDGNSNS